MRLVRFALAVAATAAFTGCGGEDRPGSAPATSDPPATAGPAEGAQRGAVPTGTGTGTGTGTASRPAGPARPGDLDGDGVTDHATLAGDSVTVRASTAGRLTARITPASTLSPPNLPAVLGIRDTDGDGYGEVWVRVETGANTAWVRPVRYDGTTLRELTVAGRGPLTLYDGGGVLGPVRFSCAGPFIYQLESHGERSTPTSMRYDGTVETFRVNRTGPAVPVGTEPFTGQHSVPAPPGTRSCGLDP